MTPYKKYQKKMTDLETSLDIWLRTNKMTQMEMARKIGIEPPLLTHHKIKYRQEKYAGKIMLWPEDIIKGIIRITKGEISLTDFAPY